MLMTHLLQPNRFDTPTKGFDAMDRLFEVLAPPMPAKLRGHARDRLTRTEHGFRLLAKLPGIRAEDIELEVGEDHLEIRAKRELAVPEGFQLVRRECSDYNLDRHYALPEFVDLDAVEATMTNGMLVVELPVRAKAEIKRITIASED